MKGNITIKDVAKQAGVSISTVSRVINDSKPVTDEVKQKVLEVIKETGYIPNPLARSLVTKKSQLIGVIVPEVSDSFVNEVLNGIEEVAKMYDYDILLANTYSDKEQELKSINLLRAKQVEGIVMISWIVEQEHINYIQNCGIPATYISKTARNYDIYTVSTSNEEATFDMTEHLIKKGHEKIAFIMTSRDDTVLEMERLAGYEKALSNNNIELDKSLIKYGGTDYESGYNSMKELLDDGIIPHAAFVTG
ncbi:LacI family transcriptional regulator CcpA, partial [Clostridioides difficile]